MKTDWPFAVSFKEFTPTLPIADGANFDAVKILVLSDVHLGHGRVSAKVIIKYLKHVLRDEVLKTLRAIIISGDLFDKRLTHDSDDAMDIARWLEPLCRKCAKYNTSLILLEGTPSHDNRQSRWVMHYNEMVQAGADIRYYDKITVDALYEDGPLTLFVPDEVNHDANKTWKQVTEALAAYGVDQVDFAVMHGMFTFQEPVRSVASHMEERYESIVKHLIIIGHHHKPAVLGKIRVPGSPERLRYNEEHDKGHFIFTYSKAEGISNEVFIVNTEATIFKSIDVVGKSFNDVAKILKGFEDFPDGSHVRLEISRNDEVFSTFNKLEAMFPQLDLSKKPIEAQMATQNSEHLVDTPVMTSIRPDNLAEILLERVQDEDAEVLAVMKKILAA